jgi:hypothetical protein
MKFYEVKSERFQLMLILDPKVLTFFQVGCGHTVQGTAIPPFLAEIG